MDVTVRLRSCDLMTSWNFYYNVTLQHSDVARYARTGTDLGSEDGLSRVIRRSVFQIGHTWICLVMEDSRLSADL